MTVGVVIIGRNEGERFERCLGSLVGRARPIVYVDSGSTDGSVAFAEGFVGDGVEVVRLDMTKPFTAARARNAGLERLLAVAPATEFVQFVDGDCEVREGWLEAGVAKLSSDATLAVVSGRLRERFPEKSLYNRLADLEWDRPVGEEKSCGGNAMMRVEALRKVGGFDPGLIAGEEPELCARMRAQGYRIWRLADEMAWHDIAMMSSLQWMTRAKRHGHAILEVSLFKTTASRMLFKSQIRSALVWGLFAWLVLLCSFAGTLAGSILRSAGMRSAWYMCLAILVLMPIVFYLQGRRLRDMARRRGLSESEARDYARLLQWSKVYQVLGMLEFLWRRLRKKEARIIDYRSAK